MWPNPQENGGITQFNPFVSIAPFLYPMETLENRTVFWCFRRVGKGCIGNEWVNKSLLAQSINVWTAHRNKSFTEDCK